MKKWSFIIFVSLIFIIPTNSQRFVNNQIRNNKNNEISLLLNSMWKNEFLSYGLSYERTFYHFDKNNLKPYISGQMDIIMRMKTYGVRYSPIVRQKTTKIKLDIFYK
jgi:hypothetical protein